MNDITNPPITSELQLNLTKTLSDYATKLLNLRKQKAEVDAHLTQLKEEETELKRTLLAILDEQQLQGFRTENTIITITKKEQPSVVDYDAFWKFVISGDNSHFIQRRPSSTACIEYVNLYGTPVPGINLIPLRDISLRTVKNGK